jgi:hypothetical protein
MSTSVPSLRPARERSGRVVPIGGLGVIALASAALAAVTLLAPTTPTYDPYAWLIWGREVLHLDLDTDFGPSWKPLPVLLTTVFGLVPSAAPDLWVAVARAGAIASLLLAVRVGWRLGGGLLGGLLAAACLAVTTGSLRYAWIGDSEGLLVALLLAAVDLHLSGRRRGTLWVAFAACLLRPEAWPLAAAYAAWLWRRDPALRRTIAGMVVGGVALWFGPELWGSGNALRAGERARDPNPDAITFAEHPAWEAVKRTVEMTAWPARVGVVLLAVGWLDGRWRGARAGAIAVALGAVLWTAEVAIMTEGGFSGNARYMLAPVALLCVAGGVGWGRAFALAGAPGLLVGAAVAGALLVAPARVLPDDLRTSRNEALLNDALSGAVRAAGGPAAVRACGPATTGPFQVTALAWRLDVPIEDIQLVPLVPGSVFRAGPAPRAIPGAPQVVVDDPRWKRAVHFGPWEVLRACEPPSGG